MSILSSSSFRTKLVLRNHPSCLCLIPSARLGSSVASTGSTAASTAAAASSSSFCVIRRTITMTAEFKAERAIKQAKRKAAAEKKAAAEAYLANLMQKQKPSSSSSSPQQQQQEYESPLQENETLMMTTTTTNDNNNRGKEWRDQERQYLLDEAGFMARSLYRTCLRSVNLMRVGNDHDEAEFKAREEARIDGLEDDDNYDDIFGMTAPVDRTNELRSRAEYYYSHTREHYHSDFDCLHRNPWKEHDIALYLQFLKTGEKKRRYVLRDYKFDDPYKSVFDNNRVKDFEKRADELLKDTYQANGWMLSAEMEAARYDTEHDPEFDFDDDPDEKKVKI